MDAAAESRTNEANERYVTNENISEQELKTIDERSEFEDN